MQGGKDSDYGVIIGTDTAFELHNVPDYIEGEHIWSYLSRLTLANGFSNVQAFLNLLFSNKHTKDWHRFRDWPYDGDDPLIDSLIRLRNGKDWIEELTMYPAIMPFTSREFQANKILSYAMPARIDLALLHHRMETHVKRMMICPKCLCEDRDNGTVHFRTVHLMKGIDTCPYHDVKLVPVFCRKGDELITAMEMNPVAEPGDPMLAESLEYLLRIRPRFCLEDSMAFVRYALESYTGSTKRAYILRTIRSDEILSGHGPECQALLKSIMQKDIKTMINPAAFLYFINKIYGSFSFFLEDTQQGASYEPEFHKRFDKDYELLTPWSETLIRLRCRKCGTEFPSTPVAMLAGWGCPQCDEVLTCEELMERMLAPAIDGKYEIISLPDGKTTKMTIREMSTGDYYSILPHDLIYTRFSTKKPRKKKAIMDFDYYAREISALGDFKLLKMDKKKRDFLLTIRHNGCGQIFNACRRNFVKTPYCRCCQGVYISKDFEGGIKEASNGKYRWTGDAVKRKYTATDGERNIESDSFHGLIRKVRVAVKEKRSRSDLEHEYAAIEGYVLSHPAEIITIEDLSELIGNPDTARSCCAYLKKKNRIKCYGHGLYSRPDFEASPSLILYDHYISHRGKRIGTLVGNSFLAAIGAPVDDSVFSFAQPTAPENCGHHWKRLFLEHSIHNFFCPFELTEENHKIASLMLTVRYHEYCEWSDANKRILLHWAQNEGISLESCLPYRPVLKDWHWEALKKFFKGERPWGIEKLKKAD